MTWIIKFGGNVKSQRFHQIWLTDMVAAHVFGSNQIPSFNYSLSTQSTSIVVLANVDQGDSSATTMTRPTIIGASSTSSFRDDDDAASGTSKTTKKKEQGEPTEH